MIKAAFLLAAIIAVSLCVQQSIKERPLYNLSPEVFSKLPLFPGDFYAIDAKISSLELSSVQNLGEEYYKQPEFYPTFEDQGVQLINNPPAGRIGIIGLGAYPAEQSFTAEPDANITTSVFFHASWLVQTYQGISLAETYDNRYFHVSTYPEAFLLGPSYPVFDINWTRKIIVMISVKPETPAGKYIIGIDAGRPSEAQEEEWRSAYGQRYANSFGGIGRHFLTVTINVK